MRKPKYLIVENHKGLIRDADSKGIINVDQEALMEHRRRKAIINKKNRQIEKQQHQLNSLQDDVDELKTLVTKILEKQ